MEGGVLMSRAACGHLHLLYYCSSDVVAPPPQKKKLGAPGSCPVGPPLSPVLFWDVTPYWLANSCVIYQSAQRHFPANTNLRLRGVNFKVSQALREMWLPTKEMHLPYYCPRAEEYMFNVPLTVQISTPGRAFYSSEKQKRWLVNNVILYQAYE